MDDKDKIEVPEVVIHALAAVRESAITNMLDRERVTGVCVMLGYAEASRWLIDASDHDYMEALNEMGSRSA